MYEKKLEENILNSISLRKVQKNIVIIIPYSIYAVSD